MSHCSVHALSLVVMATRNTDRNEKHGAESLTNKTPEIIIVRGCCVFFLMVASTFFIFGIPRRSAPSRTVQNHSAQDSVVLGLGAQTVPSLALVAAGQELGGWRELGARSPSFGKVP